MTANCEHDKKAHYHARAQDALGGTESVNQAFKRFCSEHTINFDNEAQIIADYLKVDQQTVIRGLNGKAFNACLTFFYALFDEAKTK